MDKKYFIVVHAKTTDGNNYAFVIIGLSIGGYIYEI